MQEMVFVGNSLKDEPYTTADAIAQYAEVQRGTVDRLIRCLLYTSHQRECSFRKIGSILN